MFRLVIFKKDGSNSEHSYDDYETMDYNAVLCRFSTNIVKVLAQECTLTGWKTLYTIG